MRYHITRKTGGLSRIIERGVKGVDFLLRFLLFSIGPLILELLMIGVVLTILFDWTYLLVVAVTIGLYVWFTFSITEWRVRQRRQMNEADTDANQKAVDSLLNGNRRYRRYLIELKGLLEKLHIPAGKVKIVPVEHQLAHASSAYHLDLSLIHI